MNVIKTLLISIVLVFCSANIFAQDTIGDNPPPDLGQDPIQTQPTGTNYIPCTSYKSISYNGYTIEQISAKNGNFQQLWSSPDLIEDHDGWGKTYHYGQNTIGYADGYFSGMTIINQWPIKVLGKEIKVGDSFSELQQKFGQDLKIIYKPVLGPEYVVSFNCSGNESDGLHIIFNPLNHQIKEIKYWVNT